MRKFTSPLSIEERELPPLKDGEVLVKLSAAGICGSDLHIWKGNDPRIVPPLILGHEGVGIVQEVRGERADLLGRVIQSGDLVTWDRGITCGQCYFCAVKKEPSLCLHRQVYGISRDGCYASHLVLTPETKILKIESDVDPAILVSASCSGATAVHAVELCDISVGDTVVVQGPGPLGIFTVALAREKGAEQIIIVGTRRSKKRVELCLEFGATSSLIIDDTSPRERLSFVLQKTHGLGADVVIDCTGSPQGMVEGIEMAAPGGVYALPGVAIPIGEVPIDVYRTIARKNLRIQGVWVSDTSHFYEAVKLILSKRYPFEKLVTHRFPLNEINEALRSVEDRRAIKAVILDP